MVVESLNKMVENKGVLIKVEINGLVGVKNKFIKDEIENVICIIVVVDKNVEMVRFNGKKVIKIKVVDGIYKVEEFIDKVVNGDVLIYYGGDGSYNELNEESESGFRKVYKYLMNGVFNMLLFVIGGGIFIVIVFLFDDYIINFLNFGLNIFIVVFFKGIGDKVFGFMLFVFVGYIVYFIFDRLVFVVGFVGGVLVGDGGLGFLGVLFVGFIVGYLVEGFKKIFSVLLVLLEGIKLVLLYFLFGIFLMGIIMIFLVIFLVIVINNVMVGFLNGLGGILKIFLGLVLGGMMVVDMGGFVNKVVYVFGVVLFELG